MWGLLPVGKNDSQWLHTYATRLCVYVHNDFLLEIWHHKQNNYCEVEASPPRLVGAQRERPVLVGLDSIWKNTAMQFGYTVSTLSLQFSSAVNGSMCTLFPCELGILQGLKPNSRGYYHFFSKHA